MTGTDRPGDAARRALRAARERAEEARGGAGEQVLGEPVSGEPGAPGAEPPQDGERVGEAGSAVGAAAPGDAARAALRAAVAARTTRPDDGDAPEPDGGGGEAGTDDDPAVTPPGERQERRERRELEARAASARLDEAARTTTAETPVRDAPPTPDTPDTAGPEGRPGDVAREALRAARREARRAEAVAPGRRARTNAPARPASSAPGAAPDAAGATRVQAAREMRTFLSNAFRMPSWTDDPQETPRETALARETGETGETGEPWADGTAAHEPGTAHPHPTAPAHEPAAHLPATMATPHRDTELRRTFPALPPRAASSEDAEFAETWWGNAWVDALEQGALDAKRLARGRGYADQGHVDAITVTPGLVLAYVRGSRPRPYRVQVRLRTLEDEDWERFLDAAADRPGHIAALLDKELPQSLADCGVPLLPGPRDLAPRCSCPDSGHPCKHAAALCYQTARLLDADPFVLLLLRGRGEKDLLDALSRRSAARAARAAQEGSPRTLPGVRATDALAPRGLPPLPPPLPAPPHPEQPPVYPAAPGGPDPFALDQLATDAAARAHALLTTGRDPVGELTLWQDAVRLAAARPGSGLTAGTRALYATLAAAAGRTPADLARAVAAWRQGGLEGLAVLEEPWDPPAGRFDRARPLLLAADLPAFRPWHNHLTHPRGHVQLRLGRDGLWYAYESEPGHDDWWPRGTPDLDPVGALTGLGSPGDL
ncbi:SWIM zinc finger family protein [Streptomyces bungoensis]|uniref:SWIM zinc finger family protein n=1 Tax=Streptomyces bungoensis TaxID=285568 RepID=UPI003443FC32